MIPRLGWTFEEVLGSIPSEALFSFLSLNFLATLGIKIQTL